jgi:hypothetical protein
MTSEKSRSTHESECTCAVMLRAGDTPEPCAVHGWCVPPESTYSRSDS